MRALTACTAIGLAVPLVFGATGLSAQPKSDDTAKSTIAPPLDPNSRDALRAALAPMVPALKAFNTENAPTEPTPEQLVAARELVAAMGAEERLKPLLIQQASDARNVFDQGAANLPPEQKHQAGEDFDQAYKAAFDARVKTSNEKAAAYFAARLSSEDLRDAAAFYKSDIGRSLLSTDHVRTPEESQKFGRYVIDHPAFLKLFKPSIGYLQIQLAEAQTTREVFKSDVRTRLCIRLALHRIGLPTCARSGA